MKSSSNLSKLLFTLLGLFIFSQGSAQVVINEFMATNLCSPANPNNFQDNFGDCSDWVELYNTTGAPFDLAGYYFSDNPNNLTKYQFPAGSVVPANGFLRLWLSGRPNIPFNLANIHLDFMIGQTYGTEVLSLVNPDGTTVEDSYAIITPCQLGHSMGRSPDGADNWMVFDNPTMAAPNTTAAYNYAPTPVFSEPAGYHGGAINVAITIPAADPSYTIRYTTDGTFPNPGSTAYSGPVNLSTTTVLTAATFSSNADVLPSFYEYSTYFFGADQHTVNVFSVHGDQVPTLLNGTQIEPLAALEIFDENGQRISKNFGDINKHGNDSWAYDQRGFDWVDRDKMGYSRATELQLFRGSERESFKRYMFKAAANDNYPEENGAYIRDAYLMSLSQVGNLELDERSAEFGVVYINGQYWGVYDYREKVDDWHFTDFYYNQGKYDIDFLKTWGGTWAEYGDATDWNALRNFITTNDMTDQTNYDYVKTQLNVLSLIDYFAINTWAVCADWLNWNTAWWKGNSEFGEAQKWRYTLWDMDASFGHYVNYTGVPNTGPTADPCFGEQLNNPGGQGHTDIMSELLNNDEFFNTYINRYADLQNSTFSCDFAIQHLDSLIAIIAPEMQRQIDRWGGNYAQWEANVQEIRDFILSRCEDEMISGMEDCYDIEAIEVTVMIEGDGEVQLNGITITPDMQPWTGTYYIGVPLDFTAIEYAPGTFEYWESLVGDIGIGDETQFEINISPTGDITIVAYFIPLEEYPITFDVQPAGSGQIEINGDLVSNFLYTDSLAAGPEHGLVAIPEPGWSFVNWETITHTPAAFTPDDTTEDVGYTLEQTDTVIAHFELMPVDLTIDVDQVGMGNVVFNGTELGAYPHTETLEPNTAVNLEAVPQPGYQFDGWSFDNHIVSNLEDLLIMFNITQDDVVVAHFSEITEFNVVIMTEPAEFGTVDLDEENIGSFWEGMLSINESYSLRAVPESEFYEFVGWESVNGATFSPNTDMKNVTLDIFGEDTVIARFVELPNYEIIVRTEPAGAGRVMLDWSVLPYLPWTGRVLGLNHTDFKALPGNEWKFSHWTTVLHNITPSDKLEEMWLDISQPDEIVAHFVPREFYFYMPNSFSPNEDGINDIFKPVGNEWKPQEYRMQIFNRNGELVFETTNPDEGWNGSVPTKTHYAKTEVYVYQVEVVNAINDQTETFSGHVTVLR